MITYITSAIGIATAVTIVILIRKDHLHVRYGLWWMSAALLFAVVGLFPGIVDSIAHRIGVGYPPTLALTVGLVAVVLKILQMDIERSRNAVRLQRLVQRLALLESELRDLQNQAKAPDAAAAHAESDEPFDDP